MTEPSSPSSAKPAAATAAAAKTGRHAGIRIKLIGAFAAVAGTTLVAAGVAWFGFGQVGGAMRGIVDHDLPAMTEAQALSQQAAGIPAAVGDLFAAADTAGLEAGMEALNARAGAMDATIETLGATGIDSAALERMRAEVFGLIGNLRDKRGLVADRIALDAERAALVAEIGASHATLLETLDPMIQEARFASVRQSLDVKRDTQAAIEELTGEAIVQLNAALDLRAEALAAIRLMARALDSTTALEAEALREPYGETAERLAAAAEMLDAGSEQLMLDLALDRLQALGGGEGNVFDLATTLNGDGPLAERMAAAEPIEAAREALPQIEATLEDLLGKVAANTRARMDQTAGALVDQVNGGVDSLVRSGMETLRLLQELAARANLLAGVYNEAAGATDPARLDALAQVAQTTTSAIYQGLGALPEGERRDTLFEIVNALVDVGSREQNVFEVRRQLLAVETDLSASLDEATAVAARLGEATRAFSDAAVAEADLSADAALGLLERSRLLLAAIAGAAVLIAALIGWLWVDRSLLG
ncbi:MAG: hypothetical protein GVY28_03960, partial [Alphaproteobacteria bacterium]|nr:hypothetical protein [Alphaproteobacteria bacterium]